MSWNVELKSQQSLEANVYGSVATQAGERAGGDDDGPKILSQGFQGYLAFVGNRSLQSRRMARMLAIRFGFQATVQGPLTYQSQAAATPTRVGVPASRPRHARCFGGTGSATSSPYKKSFA